MVFNQKKNKALSTKLKTFCISLFSLQLFIFPPDFYSCLPLVALAQTQIHSYWRYLCNTWSNPTISAQVTEVSLNIFLSWDLRVWHYFSVMSVHIGIYICQKASAHELCRKEIRETKLCRKVMQAIRQTYSSNKDDSNTLIS
jgi:hypothetical protein